MGTEKEGKKAIEKASLEYSSIYDGGICNILKEIRQFFQRIQIEVSSEYICTQFRLNKECMEKNVHCG